MQQLHALMLGNAGRLLLEYNESTREIHRSIAATAQAITDDKCDVAISYNGVAIALADHAPLIMPVRELRYDAALQARVHSLLRRVQSREIDVPEALAHLKRVEAETSHHPRSLTALLLGLAAASLARLIGADVGSVIVAGIATGLGLVARQELGRRRFSLLTLPFAAGFVGAILGGLAIQGGWTHTPELALIVPSLMLIPGPHLINGLLDLIDNYVPMSMARFGLATGILIATAIGIALGIQLTLREFPLVEQSVKSEHLNVFVDMFLAGIVTIGFAVFYNTTWPHTGMAAAGGIVGHGLRFLATEAGWGLVPATFIGGLAVGVMSTWIVRLYKIPFAVIAFAGAVTMMPGLQIYRAIGGSMKLARLNESAELSTIAATSANAWQACFVVIALALGLIVASRAVLTLAPVDD
jgi:uncharacterized membrane protein YjjP (DUF1212 family)